MMFAIQRLAFRIAKREALRYKGRSVLSITLLGLPLLGVAIGASAYDTVDLSPEEFVELNLGANDAYIEFANPGVPITQSDWSSQWPSYGWDPVDSSREVPETEILETLPDGSRITPFNGAGGSAEDLKVETPDGLGGIGGLSYDLHQEAYGRAGIELLEGSVPDPGQVALSEAAAEYLELGAGDRLVVDRDEGTDEYEIAGIVELPWDINGRFAIGTVFEAPPSGWLVDVPGEFTAEDSAALNEIGMFTWSRALVVNPPPPPEGSDQLLAEGYRDDTALMFYGLIVVVAVMEVVLLAGPAFAISARRRSREFALMSANGATPGHIRATVLAGGVLFGLVAAVVAVSLGIGAVAAGMPVLERMFGYRVPGLRVLPWLQLALVGAAVATGLLAALAAAVSASRINVVAALTGRTPPRKGSKRLMAVGLVTVALGLAAGFAGVTMWSTPLMAGAIILAQLGLVACTPALLAGAARLGRWLPLAPRMALREAGRNRGSAAPAIAAVLGVVAGGMAFAMIITADAKRQEQWASHEVPQGTMTFELYDYGDPAAADAPPDLDAEAAALEPLLDQHLDDMELVEIPLTQGMNGCTLTDAQAEEGAGECAWNLTRPEANRCPYWEADPQTQEEQEAAIEDAREDPRCNEGVNEAGGGFYYMDYPTTDDPQVVAAYTGLEGDALDDAVAVLESGGVLVADELALTGEGTVVFEGQVTIWPSDGGDPIELDRRTLEVPAYVVDEDLLGFSQFLLGPGAAEQMGYTASEGSRRYLVLTSTPPGDAPTEALAADLDSALEGELYASFTVADYTDRETMYIVLAATGLCALIALGATAVSTGLIIAEQKQEMTTLGAVGAAPGLRKRFAMWQTVVIALFGAGLGTAAGFLGYALIREALNRPLQNQYPFQTLYGWELPWAGFAVMLVAVPVIAAAGALVFTKARLASERRIT